MTVMFLSPFTYFDHYVMHVLYWYFPYWVNTTRNKPLEIVTHGSNASAVLKLLYMEFDSDSVFLPISVGS